MQNYVNMLSQVILNYANLCKTENDQELTMDSSGRAHVGECERTGTNPDGCTCSRDGVKALLMTAVSALWKKIFYLHCTNNIHYYFIFIEFISSYRQLMP